MTTTTSEARMIRTSTETLWRSRTASAWMAQRPSTRVVRFFDGPMHGPEARMTWRRTSEGYADSAGRAAIYDNGPGFGSARGSGRWAVEIDGRWVANVDYLAAAKQRAAVEVLT